MMTNEEMEAFRDALAAAGYDTREKIIELVRQVKREQADELEWLRAASKNPAFDFLHNEVEDIYSPTDGEPFNQAFRRAYVPTTTLAKSVRFDDEMMYVTLIDGRIIGVPIAWFPLLQEASVEQRQNYQIEGGGISIHWPEIDEDLSIAGMLAGVDWQAV